MPAAVLLARKMSFLFNYVYPDGVDNTVFVPVPISKKRRRTRGCNQSEVLAKELSALTGVPVVKNAGLKIKDNPAQSRTPRGYSRHTSESTSSPSSA